jgi:D-cysteine desulfhydrase
VWEDGAEVPRPPVSPLERRVPGLRGRRLALGDWPTPIRHLDVPGGRLWVKDEGAAASPYGGNKVRKLEWVLPRVAGRSALVTFGAVGSNHVLATAWYARRVGSAPTRPGAPARHPRGPPERGGDGRAGSPRVAGDQRGRRGRRPRTGDHRRAARGRPRPAVVWVGGSTPAGLLGWVDAALELADQVAAGELPAPGRIVVPAGSGGVAAGLLVGLGMTPLRARIHAVRVADPIWANRRSIGAMATMVRRTLRGRAPVCHVRTCGGWCSTPTTSARGTAARPPPVRPRPTSPQRGA